MAKKKLFHSLTSNPYLHRDNRTCSHILNAGPMGEHLIATPCPKCGSNMLTRKDFLTHQRYMRMVDWVNRWFGWLGTKEPPKHTFRVETHVGKTISTKVPREEVPRE